MARDKIIYIFILIAVVSLSFLSIHSIVTAGKAVNLYKFALGKNETTVYLGEFSDPPGKSKVSANDIKRSVMERLQQKKEMKFNIANKAEHADLVISGRVIDFIYRQSDPIDIILPIGLVMDILTNKNYAHLRFEMTVYDTNRKKTVWKRRLKATATEFNMPEEKSIPLITDRAARVFIDRCFGRPRSRIRL